MLATQTTPAYRRDPRQKQDQLLRAAAQLFAEQGFANTSTQQIARAAGVSEGILFHHFGSKQGLLVKIAEDYAQEAALFTMPEAASGGPDGLTEESVVRKAFAFAERNPALHDMLARTSREFADAGISMANSALVDAIQHNLEQGMANGEIRQGNARIMAQLQFAVVVGAYEAWRECEPAERDALQEAYIQEAINCMQAMLKPHRISTRRPSTEVPQ